MFVLKPVLKSAFYSEVMQHWSRKEKSEESRGVWVLMINEVMMLVIKMGW